MSRVQSSSPAPIIYHVILKKLECVYFQGWISFIGLKAIPEKNLSKQLIDCEDFLCNYFDRKEVVNVIVPIGDFYMCGQISGNEIQK